MHRLGEVVLDLVQEESGEELQTFEPIGWTNDDDDPEPIPIPRTGREVPQDKREELEFELSQKIINLEALRSLVGNGHLVGEMRPLAWKLLLGYLPVEEEAWEQELSNNRLRYAELKTELLLNPSSCSSKQDEMFSLSKPTRENDIIGPLCRREISDGDHPLSLGRESIWYQYFKDAEISEQIDRDLQRTHPDIKFFSEESAIGKSNKKAMRNILLLFAKLNPAIGYVQGMNEVLAPLYYVFSTDPDEQNNSNVEADSFCCFVKLMSDSVDHFCQQLDNSAVGIHATLSQLNELLKVNDEELWKHLEISKVRTQFYAFRWITLLLTQEFEFHSITRIWDSLLSNPLGVQEMLLRVCCAMLLCVKRELLDGDFMSNMKLLQHYPKTDIERILDVAQQNLDGLKCWSSASIVEMYYNGMLTVNNGLHVGFRNALTPMIIVIEYSNTQSFIYMGWWLKCPCAFTKWSGTNYLRGTSWICSGSPVRTQSAAYAIGG